MGLASGRGWKPLVPYHPLKKARPIVVASWLTIPPRDHHITPTPCGWIVAGHHRPPCNSWRTSKRTNVFCHAEVFHTESWCRLLTLRSTKYRNHSNPETRSRPQMMIGCIPWNVVELPACQKDKHKALAACNLCGQISMVDTCYFLIFALLCFWCCKSSHKGSKDNTFPEQLD